MEVCVSAPTFSFRKVLAFPTGSVVRNLVERFDLKQDLYVVSNGRLSDLDELLHHGSVYHLELRLRGGKGGFGSMLRALGAQIEKTTNREACRDLSGRRLRDVNHEKEMAEWLKKQAEREAEREQRRVERLQRKLTEPKHLFTDPQYQQQCHHLSERLEESVLKGLQASSSTQVTVDDVGAAKRRSCDGSRQPAKKKKKKTTSCFWTGVGELVSSEEEDEEDEDEESQSCWGVAVVPMATQRGEGAEPGPSSSRTPEARAAGPPQTPEARAAGPPQTPEARAAGPPQTPEPRAAGPPQTPEARAAGPPQTPEARAAGPPQTPGHRAGGPPQTPEARAAGPPQTPEARAAGPPQTPNARASGPQQTPGEFNRSCQLAASLASVQELEALGLDVLKEALMSRGLKCGGTLSQRAARLFSVRGLSPDQIDPALLAKPARK